MILFVLCFVVMIAIFIYYIVTINKNNVQNKRAVLALLYAALSICVLYLFSAFVPMEQGGLLLIGLYFTESIWFSILFLNYVHILTDNQVNSVILKSVLIVILVTHCSLLLVNVTGEFMFSLVQVCNDEGEFMRWNIEYKSPFFLSMVTEYSIMIYSILLLFKKALDLPKMYRNQYLVLGFSYSFIVFLKLFGYILKLNYDMSFVAYVLLGASLCYFSINSVPKQLVMNILHSVCENSSSAIICFDYRGKCIYVNNEAAKIIGADKSDMFPFEEKYKKILFEDIAEKNWEERFVVEGSVRRINTQFKKITDNNDKYLGSFVKLDDRTDEVKKYKEEKYKATHDTLTGLLNKRSFIEEASALIERFPNEKFCMMATNIHKFKLVNDLFGNKTGDMILVKHSEIIKKMLGEKAVTGRIGGDRFALLVPQNRFDKEAASDYLEEIEQLMDAYNYKLNISLGVYFVEDNSESVSEMYDKALMAIEGVDYISSLCIYDTKIMEKAIREKSIISEFDRALESGEFVMYLQPQIDGEQNVVGAEALVRWIHPANGIIMPGKFIKTLEDTGLIQKLDVYIWEEAAKKLHEWQSRGIDKYISVNVSAKDFYYLDIYRVLTSIVRKYDISPEKLKLEITERVILDDIQLHVEVLRKLKRYGFEIEVDDFGTGYSSLSMLKDVNANFLKIDMLFLKGSYSKERNRIVLETIIELAESLGMKVISEGIETEEQMEIMKSLGCDYFQGYLISKPVSYEEFAEKWL